MTRSKTVTPGKIMVTEYHDCDLPTMIVRYETKTYRRGGFWPFAYDVQEAYPVYFDKSAEWTCECGDEWRWSAAPPPFAGTWHPNNRNPKVVKMTPPNLDKTG